MHQMHMVFSKHINSIPALFNTDSKIQLNCHFWDSFSWIAELCHLWKSLPALKLNWFKFPISMAVSVQLWSYHPSLLLQDGSLHHRHDIKDIWYGLRYQNVTFCSCVYSIFVQTNTGLYCIGVCHHYKVQKFKACKYFVHECGLIGAEESFITHCAEQCPSNWKGISYQRPTGSFIEYCFREWLTPNCFVFARRETSEAEGVDSGWKWAAVGGWGVHLSCKLSNIKSPFYSISFTNMWRWSNATMW